MVLTKEQEDAIKLMGGVLYDAFYLLNHGTKKQFAEKCIEVVQVGEVVDRAFPEKRP